MISKWVQQCRIFRTSQGTSTAICSHLNLELSTLLIWLSLYQSTSQTSESTWLWEEGNQYGYTSDCDSLEHTNFHPWISLIVAKTTCSPRIDYQGNKSRIILGKKKRNHIFETSHQDFVTDNVQFYTIGSYAGQVIHYNLIVICCSPNQVLTKTNSSKTTSNRVAHFIAGLAMDYCMLQRMNKQNNLKAYMTMQAPKLEQNHVHESIVWLTSIS